jgi:hypothetical protein
VSYSEYGERGSIDLLAWHPPTRVLLAVEVKTEIVSVEATLRKHDEKARLAPGVARRSLGWEASRVVRLLVLPNASTPRRQVARHAALFDAAYPIRGHKVRTLLRTPADRAPGRSSSGAEGVLLFLSPTTRSSGSADLVSPRRVRTSQAGCPVPLRRSSRS